MPTPTTDEILDAAATIAGDGVASSTVDGRSVNAMDPLKQIEVADRLASRDLLAGTNDNGGAKTGWALTRPARAIPPGAV